MNELVPDKVIKIGAGAASTEASALNHLLKSVNTPEFSNDDGDGPFVPPNDPVPAAVEQASVAPRVANVTPQTAVPPTSTKRQMPDSVYTTGRLRVGKDHVLKALGYQIHGFAEPLYALQKYFFGTDDKTVPGARKFLQMVGQWGRGQVDNAYPISAQRASFTTIVRGLGQNGQFDKSLGVRWEHFGQDPDLWLNAFLTRHSVAPAGRNAVSNVRFSNELNGLTTAGWIHFHVMCSPATWAKRLKEVGLTPSSPEVNDTSEQLAVVMDRDSMQRVRLKPQGPKLRVIWNDLEMRSPSPRFFTLNELE